MTASTTQPKFKRPRNRVQLTFPETGRTHQEHKDECDINKIMSKYQKQGATNHVTNHEANYGFADSATFTEAMQTVANGERMFAELPSSLRNKFHHSPAEFLAFVQDESNTGEMAELGLLSEDATRAYILEKKATEALLANPPPPVDPPIPGESTDS